MNRANAVRAAFILSGMAGLVYEVLWTRYLGLYVGHGAYAQVLVLGVYLGGMAVGSLAIADFSKRLVDPLRAYAIAEVVLAVFGLAFPTLFVLATDFSYDVIFPAAGSAATVGSARWAIAGALILPQAVTLGTTFPLMAAGLVRADRSRPGGGVAQAYLLNTLGGAAGVLIAGFLLIGWFGLHGTSIAAAVLNLVAAGLVWFAASRTVSPVPSETSAGASPTAVSTAVDANAVADDPREPHAIAPGGEAGGRPFGSSGIGGLTALLLAASVLTALASFTYEIGWIRMLSLVLGSATHAFELMLSAFILGIALGAWAIRRRSDASARPVRLLGLVQVAMGLTALLSLPVYLLSFDVMSSLVTGLAGEPGGYALFNIGRYGLCMLVMLPSTILAGTTLPLITGSLLRAGATERTIGRVYAANTAGSVAGAGLAGLIALPILGLEGLIVAGAVLDIGLGVLLLERASRWSGAGIRLPSSVAAASAVLILTVTAVVDFDPATITSGVYREGAVTGDGEWRSLFYQDGRTATVSAHVGLSDGVIVLATNGKPDASVGPRWLVERRDTLPELPIPRGRDYTTQVVAPVVALAHVPSAVTVANVGHGSGMTAASLLTSESIERLVTIEIEPLMVEGSLVFLPANGPAFADPRVTYVFDDAKSYFSYQRERFDIIFAEPSNPWVSGTASLFTREFYERATDFLASDGVMAQWMQIYEIDDDLFLSVLAALDEVFASYRGYLVGDSDVAIVATTGTLEDPDWAIVETESFRRLTTSAPPFRGQHMDALLMFDQNTFRSVLEGDVPVNSDYAPVLDLGAEHTRFDRTFAEGVYSFATSRVDLARYLSGGTRDLHGYATPPAYGLAPTVLTERGNWLRDAVTAGGGIAPEEFPEWQDELVHLQTFLLLSAVSAPVGTWNTWTSGFVRAENSLHWGTTGWVEPTFYRSVYDFLDRAEAPSEPRAVVELFHGYGLGDWRRVAAAADVLVARVAGGEPWLAPELLLDLAVVAYLEVGRPDAARNAADMLIPTTGRESWNLRNRLLRSLIASGG